MQTQVRDPVSTAGALVGFVLLIYLLFAYRGALRAFQNVTNEAARRVRDSEGGQGSHGSDDAREVKAVVCCRPGVLIRRLLCACITATDDLLQEMFPDLVEDSEDERSNLSDRSGSSRFSLKASSSKGASKGSSGGGLLGDDQPHISQVEQRLRQTLRRVLKVGPRVRIKKRRAVQGSTRASSHIRTKADATCASLVVSVGVRGDVHVCHLRGPGGGGSDSSGIHQRTGPADALRCALHAHGGDGCRHGGRAGQEAALVLQGRQERNHAEEDEGEGTAGGGGATGRGAVRAFAKKGGRGQSNCETRRAQCINLQTHVLVHTAEREDRPCELVEQAWQEAGSAPGAGSRFGVYGGRRVHAGCRLISA